MSKQKRHYRLFAGQQIEKSKQTTLENGVNGSDSESFAAAKFITLKARLKCCVSGLKPHAVLKKFSAVQMLDVHLPTTDGREIVLTRYTQPEKELLILLDQLKINLPEQAPPRIYSE